MSLTKHIQDRSSPVSQHLSRYSPSVMAAAAQITTAVKGDSTSPVGYKEKYPYMLVGTAIDYRLRWYLSDQVDCSYVIDRGMRRLDDFGKLGQLGDAMQEFVDATSPLRATLSDADEDMLCRHCVVLAVADHLGRGSNGPPEFLARAKNYGPKRALASIDDRIVADLVRMSRTFATLHADLIANFADARVGCSFKGSVDIQGADVDFIVDGCLYDAKATTNPNRELRNNLYQLLGYTLLDYEDEFCIKSAALVLLRQGQTHQFDIEELLGPDQSLSDARASFASLLRLDSRR